MAELDEKASAAMGLVKTAYFARSDADVYLADAMWAAHEAGVSKNEIARSVPLWSRMTVLDILSVAQWRAGVRRVLTDAGLSVATIRHAEPKDPDVDILLAVHSIRNRRMTVYREFEPLWTLEKVGFTEPWDERESWEDRRARGDQVLNAAREEWRASVRHRAEVAVSALAAAGYQLFSSISSGSREPVSESAAVEHLVAFQRSIEVEPDPTSAAASEMTGEPPAREGSESADQ